MTFWTRSGCRTSSNASWPNSPADSSVRFPAPIRRSSTPWWNLTSLMFSKGISIESLANHPERWITRSEVTTKCEVAHATILGAATLAHHQEDLPPDRALAVQQPHELRAVEPKGHDSGLRHHSRRPRSPVDDRDLPEVVAWPDRPPPAAVHEHLGFAEQDQVE